MSILIKGMEMPKNGSITVFIFSDGKIINASSDVPAIKQGYRAIEVPLHGRLIDADALMLSIDMHGTNKFGMLDEDIREFMSEQPTIDAVPVVRCRECVHFEPFRQHDGFCKIDGMLHENDFFCKYGERREDGDA